VLHLRVQESHLANRAYDAREGTGLTRCGRARPTKKGSTVARHRAALLMAWFRRRWSAVGVAPCLYPDDKENLRAKQSNTCTMCQA